MEAFSGCRTFPRDWRNETGLPMNIKRINTSRSLPSAPRSCSFATSSPLTVNRPFSNDPNGLWIKVTYTGRTLAIRPTCVRIQRPATLAEKRPEKRESLRLISRPATRRWALTEADLRYRNRPFPARSANCRPPYPAFPRTVRFTASSAATD